MIKNSYFQLGREPLMLPIPYPRRPPRAMPTPFAVYHRPILIGCCLLVYLDIGWLAIFFSNGGYFGRGLYVRRDYKTNGFFANIYLPHTCD
jgi:hypothetical protein